MIVGGALPPLTLEDAMRHLITIVSLGAMSCGPLVTEPMPDIPETVEYKTVRIEYGGDDLLPQPGMRQQELVGDASGLAALTRLIVRGANQAIRDQIGLVDAITRFPPSGYMENTWTWEYQDERYGKLELTQSEEDPDQVSYILLIGDVKASAQEVLSGEFI